MAGPDQDAAGDPYARIAAWYDAEHDAFEDDLQFYRDVAAGSGPTVLEIGCGSGRVTAALARMGRAVTGVDSSEAMLTRCRARLGGEPQAVRERVRLVRADARRLGDDAPGPYALAIVPLNTFAHFSTPADRLAVLSGIRTRLVPGGRLAIDLDMEGPRRLLEAPGQVWLLDIWDQGAAGERAAAESAVQVAHFASAVPAREPDAAWVTHLYDALAPDGTLRRTVSRMLVALISRNEAEITLARAGFEVEATYGSYELDPYQAGDARAIFVAHS
jgi:SAM-dependent methyltransferase